jgi:hypothetical protein
MLTGCTPFLPGSLVELLRQQVDEEPPRPSQYRPGTTTRLDHVIARALGRRPCERFSDVAELRDAFRAATAPYTRVRLRHSVPGRTHEPGAGTGSAASASGMHVAAARS